MTYLARGDVALSVSMTAVSNALSVHGVLTSLIVSENMSKSVPQWWRDVPGAELACKI